MLKRIADIFIRWLSRTFTMRCNFFLVVILSSGLFLWNLSLFEMMTPGVNYVNYNSTWISPAGNHSNIPNRTSFRLLLSDTKGEIILDKDVLEHWNTPIKIWNCSSELLVLMHIPKTAGTALLESLNQTTCIWNRGICQVKYTERLPKQYTNQDCSGAIQVFKTFHADWSIRLNAEVIDYPLARTIMFRNPVDRFISHYYFLKMIWGIGEVLPSDIHEYLADPKLMLLTKNMWYDGMAGVSWLAGTDIYLYGWSGLKMPAAEYKAREQISANWSYMLNTAIDHLHDCLWIGIYEDLDKSIELFEYQTGLVVNLSRTNINYKRPRKTKLTETEINKIKALMPMDMYLYNYAKQLFEHRWKLYQDIKHGITTPVMLNSPPVLPSILDGCKTFRCTLTCPGFKYHLDVNDRRNISKRLCFAKKSGIKPNSIGKFQYGFFCMENATSCGHVGNY